MTANEIRDSIPSNSIAAGEMSACPRGTSDAVLYLGEIAAQLAELNQQIRAAVGSLTSNGTIDVTVRER